MGNLKRCCWSPKIVYNARSSLTFCIHIFLKKSVWLLPDVSVCRYEEDYKPVSGVRRGVEDEPFHHSHYSVAYEESPSSLHHHHDPYYDGPPSGSSTVTDSYHYVPSSRHHAPPEHEYGGANSIWIPLRSYVNFDCNVRLFNFQAVRRLRIIITDLIREYRRLVANRIPVFAEPRRRLEKLATALVHILVPLSSSQV